MTRAFLFASLAASAATFAGAVLVGRSPWAALAFLPAMMIHVVVLFCFARARRPRTLAYLPVIRWPALASIALLAAVPLVAVPLGAPAGAWLPLLLAWGAALTSTGVFHLEYQSIRESEHARRSYP